MENVLTHEPWDDFIKEIPIEYLKANQEKYGEITEVSLRNPVSNLDIPYFRFFNTHLFSPAAADFKRNEERYGIGVYCDEIPGTPEYMRYWTEQRYRCEKGFTVGGLYITGFHYWYLNFCPIKKVVYNYDETRDLIIEDEEIDFPSFLSMDFYFFHEFDKCYNVPSKMRRNMVLAKARRKGFSFKMAAIATWIYTFKKDTKVVIAAEEAIKSYRTFVMAKDMIDHHNQFTEFRSPIDRESISTKTGCYIKRGRTVKNERTGATYFKGSGTEIVTVSLRNKPDAAAGEGASLVIFEEAGMIKSLIKAWEFTLPILKSGAIRKGIGIIFGTGGDMEVAEEFAEMFNNPVAYDLKPYRNIYGPPGSPDCGLFYDDMWYREGAEVSIGGKKYEALDKDGNCYKWVAEIDINNLREDKSKGESQALLTSISQYCKNPEEAFMRIGGDVMPVQDIRNRLIQLQSQKTHKYTPGVLTENKGVIRFHPAGVTKFEVPAPITSFPLNTNVDDFRGCIMLYQSPERFEGEDKPPPGAYLIGYDPWKVNAKLSSIKSNTSMGAVYVLRTRKYAGKLAGFNEIVATYVGRTDRMEEFNYNVLLLAKWYNAQVNFENDVGETKPFFIKHQAIQYLFRSPKLILEKNQVSTATANRRYGFSTANRRLKEITIQYVVDWLLEPRPEGDGLRNVDVCDDIPFLQECLMYSHDSNLNFDRLSGMSGAVLAQEELYYEGSRYMQESNNSWKLWLVNNRLVSNQQTA